MAFTELTLKFKIWPPMLDILAAPRLGEEFADLSECKEIAKKWAGDNGCDADSIAAFVDAFGKVIAYRCVTLPPPTHPIIIAERERCAKIAESMREASEQSAESAGDHPCSCCENIAEAIRSGK